MQEEKKKKEMSKDLERILFRNEADHLIVLHKPRGSKGIWQVVENKSKLRVTKGKGKRLKLQYQVQVSQEQDVQVVLLDLEKKSMCKKGFNIECAKKINQYIEMDIKLLKVCKSSLQFALYFTAPNGTSWIARSVEFATHNSGTVSTKTPASDSSKITKREKRSRSSESSPAVSSPSSPVPILFSSNSNGGMTASYFTNSNSFVKASSLLLSQNVSPPTSIQNLIHTPHKHTHTPSYGISPVAKFSSVSPIEEDSFSRSPYDYSCVGNIPISSIPASPNNGNINKPFLGSEQQRFQCLTCSNLRGEMICIICSISIHGDHEIKYAGVSSKPCLCARNLTSPSHPHSLNTINLKDVATTSSLVSDNSECPAPKRQRLHNFDELGLVAQVCSQTNPLPVI